MNKYGQFSLYRKTLGGVLTTYYETLFYEYQKLYDMLRYPYYIGWLEHDGLFLRFKFFWWCNSLKVIMATNAKKEGKASNQVCHDWKLHAASESFGMEGHIVAKQI